MFATVQPAFQKEFDAARLSGDVFGYTPHWIENLFVVHATVNFIESLRDRGDIKYVTENFQSRADGTDSEHLERGR